MVEKVDWLSRNKQIFTHTYFAKPKIMTIFVAKSGVYGVLTIMQWIKTEWRWWKQ